MKKAIKCLEKRIELVNAEYDKRNEDFDSCEMVSDMEFIRNDLLNMEFEMIELKEAIKILNDKVLKT